MQHDKCYENCFAMRLDHDRILDWQGNAGCASQPLPLWKHVYGSLRLSISRSWSRCWNRPWWSWSSCANTSGAPAPRGTAATSSHSVVVLKTSWIYGQMGKTKMGSGKFWRRRSHNLKAARHFVVSVAASVFPFLFIFFPPSTTLLLF